MVEAVGAVKRLVLVVACALAWSGLAGAAVDAQGEGTKKYEPPYAKVVQGGDDFNHVEADKDSGRIDILRLFPFPSPVVGCEPESIAGWAGFRLRHSASAPPRSVAVRYDGAAMDGYSFLYLLVTDDTGEWLGSKSVKGPAVEGEGRMKTDLKGASAGEEIVITFGVQLAGACPQAGGAGARFPAVLVES